MSRRRNFRNFPAIRRTWPSSLEIRGVFRVHQVAKQQDADDFAGSIQPGNRRGRLPVVFLGTILFFGSCLISGLRHRGIPEKCRRADIGLTEDEFRSKHGPPDESHQSGDRTIWYYDTGPWGLGYADGVVIDKNHRVEAIFVE